MIVSTKGLLLFAAGLATVLAGIWLWLPPLLYPSDPGFSSAYERLSGEQVDPYPLQDMKPSPRKDALLKAVQRWPDVRSCLIKLERVKTRPNLLLVDWNQLSTETDANVCVFRIMKSIQNIEEVKKWLQFQGFEAQELDPRIVGGVRKVYFPSPGTKWPSYGVSHFFESALIYSQSITVFWDSDGQVESVDCVNIII